MLITTQTRFDEADADLFDDDFLDLRTKQPANPTPGSAEDSDLPPARPADAPQPIPGLVPWAARTT